MKKGKKAGNSTQITDVVVEIILLAISTMILGSSFITSVDWWLSYKSGDLTAYINNEEYIYLFSSIAYFLQLILVYSLALFYKININKKVLRWFNLIISTVGLACLIASFTIDYNLYIILFYLPITPAFLIHIFDRYKYKGKIK